MKPYKQINELIGTKFSIQNYKTNKDSSTNTSQAQKHQTWFNSTRLQF